VHAQDLGRGEGKQRCVKGRSGRGEAEGEGKEGVRRSRREILDQARTFAPAGLIQSFPFPHLLVDERGDGQAVEAVGEGLPQADVVAPLALIVKPVDAVDGRALVVAAEEEKVLGVLDLIREQQADGLEGLRGGKREETEPGGEFSLGVEGGGRQCSAILGGRYHCSRTTV
jgi:hypothetical protein